MFFYTKTAGYVFEFLHKSSIFGKSLFTRFQLTERKVGQSPWFLSHYNLIIRGHKEISCSWIGRNGKTFCLNIARFVNRYCTLSQALPSILVNLLSSLLLVLWNIPRDTRMTIENHCRLNFCECLTSVLTIFYLEYFFDGFTYFVKMCPKMATMKYRATYF